MPIIRPKVRHGDQKWDTYCEIGGYEHDSVTVMFYTSPAEPDVNAGGECEVNAVFLEDQGNIMESMSESELSDLQERCEEHFNDINDPDNQDSY